MVDGHDDIDEFLEATEDYEEPDRHELKAVSPDPSHYRDDEEVPGRKKKDIKPGQVSQYALFGPGYMPSTPTVDILPPGQYEIVPTQQGIYASPVPPPNGLLLELPEMRSEEVIKLIEKFWASEKDYKEGNEFVCGGANFKAGVMIYGEPGTGKSCTIKIVSKKLVESGGTVFFGGTHPAAVNSFLADFQKIEPNRKCIVILEDIDSLIRNYGESGYLDMLDGAQTINNALFIATTNYPDRLDPRVYNRPGRFSHVVKIGLPGEKAREAFLKAILKPGAGHRDIAEIVAATENFSIDHLSALVNAVYREKKDLKQELVRLRKLFRVPEISSGKKVGF